jgi:hypothetical protein
MHVQCKVMVVLCGPRVLLQSAQKEIGQIQGQMHTLGVCSSRRKAAIYEEVLELLMLNYYYFIECLNLEVTSIKSIVQ